MKKSTFAFWLGLISVWSVSGRCELGSVVVLEIRLGLEYYNTMWLSPEWLREPDAGTRRFVLCWWWNMEKACWIKMVMLISALCIKIAQQWFLIILVDYVMVILANNLFILLASTSLSGYVWVFVWQSPVPQVWTACCTSQVAHFFNKPPCSSDNWLTSLRVALIFPSSLLHHGGSCFLWRLLFILYPSISKDDCCCGVYQPVGFGCGFSRCGI